MIQTANTSAAAFLAPNATVVGRVTLLEGCSIYFGAVLRAEAADMVVGRFTNIQDNCVLHTDIGCPIAIGDGCTIGHGAIVHGCSIGDNTLVGMGAIILNGAKIGKNCLIGAGALVPQGMEIPNGSMAFGSPAKIRRLLTPEEIEGNRESMRIYMEDAREYAAYYSQK